METLTALLARVQTKSTPEDMARAILHLDKVTRTNVPRQKKIRPYRRNTYNGYFMPMNQPGIEYVPVQVECQHITKTPWRGWAGVGCNPNHRHTLGNRFKTWRSGLRPRW